ncbi:MAG: Spy/CpxP family protein refolding chaperone [Pyrinomonadaceae bacterium]|nr:Spy/CpxP family protein refolding chaperone [Pyrinomonadaceae bacterium]MCX7640449.1 Spy/CpxP family protein refolding chaperone [Pyrinomonadaceae bacterium]MDW8304876.1 Spy/CpxP family protein refolding chaperone [Acidobacteriota bacterium]
MQRVFYAFSVFILGLFCLNSTFAQKAERKMPIFSDKWAEQVGLTEDQRNQIRQILENERAKLQPLKQEQRQILFQMKDLGKNGYFDEALANQLATRKAEIDKQITIERLRTKASIFSLLTPEQREKAQQFRPRFGEKFQKFRKGKKELPPMEQ